MATVNDKAMDIADDLVDKAPNNTLKSFAQKLKDSDKNHREQAKQLRNVLE
jgi:hypothetical protein